MTILETISALGAQSFTFLSQPQVLLALGTVAGVAVAGYGVYKLYNSFTQSSKKDGNTEGAAEAAEAAPKANFFSAVYGYTVGAALAGLAKFYNSVTSLLSFKKNEEVEKAPVQQQLAAVEQQLAAVEQQLAAVQQQLAAVQQQLAHDDEETVLVPSINKEIILSGNSSTDAALTDAALTDAYAEQQDLRQDQTGSRSSTPSNT